jgi:integrase
MARGRTGTITEKAGKLYARVQFVDETGKKRDIWRKADSRTHARQIIRQLILEAESSSAAALDAASMTFDELADFFETNYLKPAVYVNGRKVAGVRSVIPAKVAVQALRSYFGKKKVRSITHSDVCAYKSLRLQTPTMYNRQRSIATVNRELDKLRRIFNIAIQRGWLIKSPFHGGDSLISLADEKHRDRILTREEEFRLLAAVEAEPQRIHLKSILLLALDCALRRGEILTLLWSDVDMEKRTVTVRAFNAKTARERKVAMTARVCSELQRICSASGGEGTGLIFGGIKSVKTSFGKTCKAAGVKDFRFHDCRHTSISRMIRAGLPPVEVMRVSGHTTMSAFYRYANIDDDTVFRAASALDAYNSEPIVMEGTRTISSELVN